MAKEKRYNGNIEAFSSSATSGNKLIFGNPTVDDDDIDNQITQEFLNGWESGLDTNNFPPMEYFNALGFTTTKLLAYLYQAGVPEWNIEQEYYIGSIASTSAGKIYVSLTGVEGIPNTGNNPVGDSTNWEDLVAKGTVTLSGDVTGSGTMEDGTNDVNITVEVKDDSHNHVIGNIDGLQTALNNKLDSNGTAVDSDKLDNKDSSEFVQTSENQTVDGIKTFSSFPITPSANPTSNYQVANKKYVDDNKVPSLVFSGDMNTLKTNGFYQIDISATNKPTAAYYACSVFGLSSDLTGQIAISAAGSVYSRVVNSIGTPTPWSPLDLQGLGVGQTWQNVKASRALEVTYTNTTGKPIEVNVTSVASNTATSICDAYVDGVRVARTYGKGITFAGTTLSFVVPNGSSYYVTNVQNILNFEVWSELR